MEEGKKSLAFSMTYFDAERTLTDEEVTEAHNRVLTTVEAKFGAELRSNKKLPDSFRQFLLIGCRTLSVSRYITKIAHIFSDTLHLSLECSTLILV